MEPQNQEIVTSGSPAEVPNDPGCWLMCGDTCRRQTETAQGVTIPEVTLCRQSPPVVLLHLPKTQPDADGFIFLFLGKCSSVVSHGRPVQLICGVGLFCVVPDALELFSSDIVPMRYRLLTCGAHFAWFVT
ncbi:hypothetical protein WN48_01721 [Eufriesea mexicana]|nr:hypothetical protein WN48_01721 [Eufriesea mexicana]